jgi:phospholipid/cholesterol/gamma-HCH transport system substrate-binding protein
VSKEPITFRRLAIVALFTVSCFLLVLMLWKVAGGPSPLGARGYRVHVLLPQSRGLGVHSDVRVSGVTIGHVTSVDVAKPLSTGRADVVIELERTFAPLRADAVARLRKKSVLGESYVALSLGSKSAPAIPEGGTLALARAQRSVEPDEVFQSFDPATREAFKQWQQSEGPAISSEGEDLNAAIATLRPWSVDASTLLSIVERQGGDVVRLLRDGGEVTSGLADRAQALQLLARSADTAFDATGDEAANLKATFTALPGFERESERTLRRLTALSTARTGDVRTLTGQLGPLSRALEALAADAPAVHRSVDATPPAARAGKAGLPDLQRLLDRTPPYLGDLDPFLRSLNPGLRYIGDGRDSLTSAIANLGAATQASTPGPGSSEPLHYLRVMPVLSPLDLAPLTQRPGIVRTNPYPANGVQRPIPSGLPSYDTRSCANPTPQVSDAPSPNLDDTTRQQLDQYVYVPGRQHVAAPPCRAQGPASGFGTSFPVLKADPPGTP